MSYPTKPIGINLEDKDLIWADVDAAISDSTNPFSGMAKANARVRPEVWPNVVPEFPVRSGAKIFTIGSCFARNIEDNLDSLGYSLPTLSFSVPQEEQKGRSANLLNKYTPASIYQEIAFAHSIFKRDGIVNEDDIGYLTFEEKPGQYLDLGLSTLNTVTFERLLERRQQVYDTFKSVFSSELVAMTLGLVEAWYDNKHETFVQFTPTRSMRKEKGRFRFCQMTYPASLEYIKKTVDLIREENKCNFLITTSPVTLARTFTEQDVIIANLESKSILRAVCGQINRDYDFVGYFPSFESAILTKDPSVYLEDNIHVAPEFVAKIVSSLVSTYFSDTPQIQIAIQQARTAHLKNSHEEVIDILKPYSGDPEFPLDGATLLLQAYIRTGNFSEAVEFGVQKEKSGLDEFGADLKSRFYSALRNVFLNVGEVAEAVRCAERAIENEPHLPVWSFEYANTLTRAGRSPEAEEIFHANIRWVDSPMRRFQFAQILKSNSKFEEARDWLYPISTFDMGANLYLEYAKLLISMGYKTEASSLVDNGLVVHSRDERLTKLQGDLNEF